MEIWFGAYESRVFSDQDTLRAIIIKKLLCLPWARKLEKPVFWPRASTDAS